MVVHRASRMMLGTLHSGARTKSLSYHLMVENGLIHPASRGLFSILPLEDELNAIGAFKMSMPVLGSKELWTTVGRWDKIGAEIFRVTDREGKQFCLQPTAEEMIAQIAAQRGVRRRTMFPFMVYQTTPKFRDEMSPRFGLLRSREFLMNDLYSFDLCEENALKTYDLIAQAYRRILQNELQFEVRVVRADSGQIGGAVSHEYHLPSDSGEDAITFCEKCAKGVNAELSRRGEKPCSECNEQCTKVIPSVEIAHTFQLGDLFTRSLGARYQKVPMVMNCYGLGIGRIIAASIDVLSPDENSLRLPLAIQPFKIVVIPPSDSSQYSSELLAYAESLVEQLDLNANLHNEVFFDDRTDYSIGKRVLLAAQLGGAGARSLRTAQLESGPGVIKAVGAEAWIELSQKSGSVELAGRLQLGYDERVNCINSNLARNRDDDSTPVRRAAFATRVPYNRSPLRALVCLGLDENAVGKRRVFFRCEMPARDWTVHILTAIKHYFPDSSKSLKSIIELTPNELYNEFVMLPCSKPLLACHSFRRSYAALCDFYDQPFREEVVWDIEKIYASHRLHVLRLDDFTHLLPRDLVPILSVCQYSSFFTGICVDGVKLASDLIEVILMVVRRSHSLTSLVLRNCSLPRDFMSLFASALQSNITIPLETIDFSKNTLDDKKGFILLSSLISKISTLHALTMSECVVSEKCVNLVASGLLQALKPNTGAQQLHLVSVDFSGNPLKDELNDLQQLISICTSLRSINLSDTGFNIDKLWPSLKFGGLQLETLKLAGCQSGRRNKDSVQNMKEYFSTAVDLKHIDFANTVMCPDLLKALLLGLASNQQLKPFALILDGVCDRGCSSVLETCMGGVDASYLSLRDNALEADALSVISATSHMPHLRRLDLSGANFTNLRRSAKHAATLNNILLEVVKLIGEEDSQLNELILSDCRLSSHLSVLLNTLGVASSLQLLDITGNEMGNFGARLLAKALQINVSLKTILIDRNQITGDGFTDIAHALKLNNTLVSMPYPLIDVADSLSRPDRAKTLSALADIEISLEKNRRGEGRGQAHYRLAISALQQEFMGKSEGGDLVADLCDKLSVALGTLANDEGGERSLLGVIDEALTRLEEYNAQCAKEFMGKSEGGDLVADLCDKLSVALGTLANDEGGERSLLGVIDEALTRLEEYNAQCAKEALGPVRRIADAEGIDMRIPPTDGSSTVRSAVVSAIADYLCELKWKDVNAAIENVVLDFRTRCNADDKRSVGSWQNKSDSPTVVNPSDSFSRSAQKSSHRPKSVVTDLCNGESFEDKLSFDSPPTASSLSHILKTRPKPARKANQVHRVSVTTLFLQKTHYPISP
ncbi:Leucine-rich repeat-containing protein 16A [Toxocara canis]|uniref:proline--tRNA ligase n=1 Tax=Toxocara canis TaxID=6265 RepID=A0A0B2VK55_TOXCA|nr:Leucine-rich repeat-containing protein 16A [Toxocara canis]